MIKCKISRNKYYQIPNGKKTISQGNLPDYETRIELEKSNYNINVLNMTEIYFPTNQSNMGNEWVSL